MTEPSWKEFEDRPPPQSLRSATPDFDAACARIFISPDGKELLAELRRRHFDEHGNELADSRALRVRIANQQFVRELERARDRGLAATAQRKDR